MLEEHDSIMRNDVWEVVSRPVGKSIVTSRWLYKTKYAADGSIEKHKAQFMARGFSQIEGDVHISCEIHFYPKYYCHSNRHGLEDT
jgi:hypothetical protein